MREILWAWRGKNSWSGRFCMPDGRKIRESKRFYMLGGREGEECLGGRRPLNVGELTALTYEFPGGTQASMSPRRTEWLRGAENYTHFFHKKINISTTIYSFFFLLSLIERYLSPLFNELIFRFFKKRFILAFLPKRYPSLYFSLCNLVIFSREYCRKWRKIYVTRQR